MSMNQISEQARTSPALRGMSPKIRAHYETIERRKLRPQRMWGGDLSVLNEETARFTPARRRSLSFQKVMLEMPVSIEPHDILVGNCVRDDTVYRCTFPLFLKVEELGKCTIQITHKCPDYETLLAKGLRGMVAEILKKRPMIEALPYEEERQARLDLIDGCQRAVDSVAALAHRYAGLAESLAREEPDPARRAELLETAAICRRVPEYPARTFHEALQSLWLVNHAIFETTTNISIGRIDNVLAPYFARDMERGALTLERAQELVDSFCLHANDRAQLDSKNYIVDQSAFPGAPKHFRLGHSNGFMSTPESDTADAVNHFGQNILISGLNADGTDSTNPLTYLFLNAHEKFSMTSPVLTVRLHKNSPPQLVDRVAEVLKTGGGMPYINNDDVILDAYEKKLGIPREDAAQYCNSSCWETMIQGMSNQEMIRGFNFLYHLELALTRGEGFLRLPKPSYRPDKSDPLSMPGPIASFGPVEGVDTGDVSEFHTFDDLMKAWRVQLDTVIQYSMRSVYGQVMKNGSHGPLSCVPFLSVLTRDCMERALDITHMGARYNLWHLMAEAVSNAADAAAAIKKFVFDEKLLTLPQLVDLLRNDWPGEEGEQLRLRFIHEAPKFGNNEPEVDAIAADMVSYFSERTYYHAAQYDEILFSPSIGTFSWVINFGKRVGASADGRKSQEYIAANMSPVAGRDLHGPLAAINSYLKLDTAAMAAGAPIDLRLNKAGLEGEEGTKRLSALIKTFLQQGGNMLTLTVTSAEELRDAMEHPERHRGLRVRMGGWSAYFVLLSKASQRMHLKRVEHGMT